MLDDIVDNLPDEVISGLNGGVYLKPEAKSHPKLPFPEYVVMGEYVRGKSIGSAIFVYYNSVMSKYVDASEDEMKKALREIILHEFRHHMETKAGCRDLEVEDEEFVAAALAKQCSRPKT